MRYINRRFTYLLTSVHHSDPMNFQISGYRTALTKIYIITKSGTASLPQTAEDVNDLRRHLIDVGVRAEQNVIGDGIDQWRKRFHACIRARGGHFECSS